jgi:hypothetical protein
MASTPNTYIFHSSLLKMEALYFSETLLHMYKAIKRHIPEECILNFQSRKNLRPHTQYVTNGSHGGKAAGA